MAFVYSDELAWDLVLNNFYQSFKLRHENINCPSCEEKTLV